MLANKEFNFKLQLYSAPSLCEKSNTARSIHRKSITNVHLFFSKTSQKMSHSATELQQLHYNILDYLTKRSRIMSAHKLRTWNDFTGYFNYQYSDYSREDLRKEFLTMILPKVFTYNLTHIQRRKVEIFATHYHFTRTTDGFLERESRTYLPVEGEHYVRSDTETQFPNVACIVTDAESVHETPCPDQLISAWTSAINSTDSEVASYCFHRGTRLRMRVTQTQRNFQETAQLPENMNPAIAKKITSFRNKAEKLSSMICVKPFEE